MTYINYCLLNQKRYANHPAKNYMEKLKDFKEEIENLNQF